MKNFISKEYLLFNKLKVKKVEYLNQNFNNSKTINFNNSSKINKIIIHHTGIYDRINKIYNKHLENKNYTKIGYHFIIKKSGIIYYTRNVEEIGSHCFQNNETSIGIAFLGNYNYDSLTKEQENSLRKLIKILKENFKIENILGHNQAIYNLIKKRFYNVKIPNINPLLIRDVEVISNLKKLVDLEARKTASIEASLKYSNKITTCPGINTYKFLQELENNFEEDIIKN